MSTAPQEGAASLVPWERRINPADPEYCARCNYARHDCRGCGADLPHGVEVCSACKALR